jgi:hypothetical protein
LWAIVGQTGFHKKTDSSPVRSIPVTNALSDIGERVLFYAHFHKIRIDIPTQQKEK